MLPTQSWLRRLLYLELLAIVVVLAVTGWWYWRSRASSLNGILLDPPQEVPAVSLQGSDGNLHTLRDFQGRVTIVFFGYTHCPDVCPTTASTMARALKLLGKDANRVQYVYVTVDPERDTPERLASYLAKYDPSFLGLTAPDETTLQQLTTAFGVYYAKVETTSALGYLVDHTASSFVLDRSGKLRLVLPFGLTPEQVASDLRVLLRQ